MTSWPPSTASLDDKIDKAADAACTDGVSSAGFDLQDIELARGTAD